MSLAEEVAAFLQKNFVCPKRGARRVGHALTLPLWEQLLLLVESEDSPEGIGFSVTNFMTQWATRT
jgi:hypothetical protein